MTTELHIEAAYAAAAATTLDTMRRAADEIACAFHADNAATLHALWRRLENHFETQSPGEADGRTARWRCRFRIYRAERPDDAIADTDAELPPDRPGSQVIAGLPNVAAEIVALTGAFHAGVPVMGLGRDELERKQRALRPTLSRRKGNAVWRVPYVTVETFNGRTTERGWLMRVDIIRETNGETQ